MTTVQNSVRGYAGAAALRAGAVIALLLALAVPAAAQQVERVEEESGVAQAARAIPAANAESAAAIPTEVTPASGAPPLAFEKNLGQVDDRVDFLARVAGYQLYLTPGGAVFSLAGAEQQGWVLRMNLVEAREEVESEGLLPQTRLTNYLTGSDPEAWRTAVPNYSRVKYARVYEGVDLVYYGNQGRVEYDFIVHPEADPSLIQLEFDGAEEVRIEDGALLVSTAIGDVVQHRPVIFQDVGGVRREVAGAYTKLSDTRVGFSVEDYDRGHELVIDPTVAYITFISANAQVAGGPVAVDAAWSAYMTGSTTATDFPTTVGAFQPVSGGDDVYVTKLSPDRSSIVYSTFVGGATSFDRANDIAVDAAGAAYVTGLSGAADFPTVNPIDGTKSGSWDAIVFKLAPDGASLAYSTFLGTGARDSGDAIALDSSGAAYVSGSTLGGFPVTPGAFDTTFNGISDFFVAKIDPAGSALVYSTYLGGSTCCGAYPGTARGLAVDAAGSAYMAGAMTASNYPLLNPIQTFGGDIDIVVTKLAPDGGSLVYSTYLGGSGADGRMAGSNSVPDLDIDSAGAAYVLSGSLSSNFPTVNAIQAFRSGAEDMVVAKIHPSGGSLVYSTYLGGTGRDFSGGIAVDSTGTVSISGNSSSANFPVLNAFDASLTGTSNMVIVQLDPAGQLAFSTFLGSTGGGGSRGIKVAVDAADNVYFGANNNQDVNFPGASPSYPTPTYLPAGTLSTNAKGVIKFGLPAGPSNEPPVADAGPDQEVECTGPDGATVTLDGTGSSDPDGDDLLLNYSWKRIQPPPDGAPFGGQTPTVPLAVGVYEFELTVTDPEGASATDTVIVEVVDTTPPELMLVESSFSITIASAAPSAAVDVLLESGATATDVCDPSVDITFAPAGPYPPGTTEVTITATDDAGLTDEATFTIDVNRAPVASAGPDQPAVECGGDKPGCAEVTLDGSGSSDPDGDALTFQWDGPGGPFAPGALVTATLPLGGPHTFTLTVTDPDGATDSDTVDVTVVDTTAPEVTAELVPVKVSKKHGTFEVRFSCEDACEGVLDGAAATLNDIIVTDGQIVRLEVKKPKRPRAPAKGTVAAAAGAAAAARAAVG